MLLSNVPQIVFTENGLLVPTSNAVLNGVLADFNAAFGGGLSLDLSTPQGQLATSLAATMNDKNAQIVYLTNQVDPQYASGFFQDAIGEIYFITRKAGKPTIVTCILTGLNGTIIPAGTLAKDTAGNVYACTVSVTIGVSGNVTVDFANIVFGAIACAANTLTVIFQSINGWDSITNPANGIPGSTVESRADFEYRRKQSVAVNATGTVAAVRGNVFKVQGILDVYVIDNPYGTSITIGTVTLVPHSLFVCAYAVSWNATLREEVANAIWLKKDVGCNYNGNTTVTVFDNGYPYPVTFQEAVPVQIYFTVNIANNPALPSTVGTDIQTAIFSAFNEKIGANVFANNYYGAILSVSPLIQIQTVYAGNTVNPVTLNFQTQITDQPLTAINNIIVNLV